MKEPVCLRDKQTLSYLLMPIYKKGKPFIILFDKKFRPLHNL